jgi:hypothetical protein
MEQLPGVIGGDPYALMRDIELSLKKTPPDKTAAKKQIADLHALLADARMKLQPQEVRRHLKTLRSAKMFDELSWMADRFAARDPDLIGTVTTSYAQGLIDSGRLVSGIEITNSCPQMKPRMLPEFWGADTSRSTSTTSRRRVMPLPCATALEVSSPRQ